MGLGPNSGRELAFERSGAAHKVLGIRTSNDETRGAEYLIVQGGRARKISTSTVMSAAATLVESEGGAACTRLRTASMLARSVMWR